jgi:ABC-2 type transport system ATP-binding protein
MSQTPAIRTEGLRKEFGRNIAVSGLDLEVHRGEVFGFLGPNGAGKTTSIKMFLDLVRPTSGMIEVLGYKPADQKSRTKVGFLPEHFRFHDWLTAAEFLRIHGQLYGMSSAAIFNRSVELLDLVGLTPFKDKQLRTYSKGMLQRIGLAQALLNHPELVFLDEPTSGLDPVGRRLVRDVIHSLRQEGTTVFLNSHLLSEVEITCDRVAFIKHGRVLQVSPLYSLVNGETTLTIRAGGLTDPMLDLLTPYARNLRRDGDLLSMVVDDEASLPAINRTLVEAGAGIYSFTPQRLSLEDLFIQVVGTDGGL